MYPRRLVETPKNLWATPDYSALADMRSAYQVIGEMRLVPFSLKTASRLVVATAAPPLVIPTKRLIYSHDSGAPLMLGET